MRANGVWAALAAGALVLAAGLRAAALPGELWLDEVWSLTLARQAQAPADVFFGPAHHHDNNHRLNTLVLHLLPDGLPPACYRLHAALGGVLVVALGGVVARRRGRRAAVIVMLLLAVSFWQVGLSTEARGYPWAIACALGAFLALERGRCRPAWLPVYWALVAVGFLCHLTFLHCMFALLLWTWYELRSRGGSWARLLAEGLRLQGVPLAFVALLYAVAVRGMELGGGPDTPVAVIVGRLIRVAAGYPEPAWLVFPLAALAALAVAHGLRLLRRDGSSAWVFFLGATVASPVLLVGVLVLSGVGFYFERYFFVAYTFALILVGWSLDDLAARSRAGAAVAAGLLALVCLGNAALDVRLIRGGRGSFTAALEGVAQLAPEGEVTVCSPRDFQVGLLTDYHGPRQGVPPRVRYVRQADLPPGGADAALAVQVEDGRVPEAVIEDRHGNRYRLAGVVPRGSPVAWGWYVYRREGAGAEVVRRRGG